MIAPKPPAQNFTPNARPRPTSSRSNLRVQTPFTNAPPGCSNVTFTDGNGSTSAVYGSSRSHSTIQYHSTNRPASGPAASRFSERCRACSRGCRIPFSLSDGDVLTLAVAFLQDRYGARRVD